MLERKEMENDVEQPELEIAEDICKFSIYSDQNLYEQISVELKSLWSEKKYFNHPSKNQFIWHSGHQPKVESIDPSSSSALRGTLNYGDSIQDEWFLVWCLFQISSKFNCEISVNDSDGEFMLIEAAEVLPKWVTPSVAGGRVWIKSGSLHLIPPEATTPQIQGNITANIALQLLRGMPLKTIAPEAVSSAVIRRASSAAPEVLTKTHLFNTKAYIHRDIANALRSDPNLIGLAVKEFWDKDADSFKACQSMSRFPPSTPVSSQNELSNSSRKDSTTVLSSINMTRPLYAMLLNHQINFHPPRPFEKVGWSLSDIDDASELKHRSIGMKIQCGFEMMLFDSVSAALGPGSTFDSNSRKYKSYLTKLRNSNYFEGEVEGSKKWKELEMAARETYLRTRKPSEDILQRFEYSMTTGSKPNQSEGLIDFEAESDEWLELDDEKLKSLFKQDTRESANRGSSEMHNEEEERLARDDVQKMTSFACSVERFVEGQGSLEGALHSDDESSEGDDDSDMSDSDAAGSQEVASSAQGGSRRAPKWARGVKTGDYTEKMKARLETIVPGVSESEWGQRSDDAMNQESSGAQEFSKVVSKIGKGKSRASESDVSNTTKPAAVGSGHKKSKLRRFAQKESYDGVCNESSDDDSDDQELDEIQKKTLEQTEDEPMEDVDMDEEREEFLKFAREALGLTEEQYETILDSRRERGAYVPPKQATHKEVPCAMEIGSDNDDDKQGRGTSSRNENDMLPSFKGESDKNKKRVHFDDPTTDEPKAENHSTVEATGKNLNLEAFDDLMNRMDSELQKQLGQQSSNIKIKKGGPIRSSNEIGPDLINRGGGGCDNNEDDELSDSESSELEMDEIDEAMRKELGELMERSGVNRFEGEGDGREGDLKSFDENENNVNYGLIGDFLESFRSQEGLPGPVGNIAGRIGVDLLGKNEK